MNYRVDLHTHSYGSPDGGLRQQDYETILRKEILDYVAITDHNQIETALEIKSKLKDFADRIIIGEEVMTDCGEIIGLYLTEPIAPGLSLVETIRQIRQQGGLVYLPHPFETVRSGVSAKDLVGLSVDIDIVEVCNGRAVFQNLGASAQDWADLHAKVTAASSDAHGRVGWGSTYNILRHKPTRQNLMVQLESAEKVTKKVGVGVLYPKFNRLRNKAVKPKIVTKPKAVDGAI